MDDMKNKTRKVLCYSPYNMWALHGMWEMTICHALKLRGVDVRYVCCDALYTDCDLFWKSTYRRHDLACQECMSAVTDLMKKMRMPNEWLGRWISPDELYLANKLANNLTPDEVMAFEYNDWQIGEWVHGSVNSHFRMSYLDIEDTTVHTTYVSYIKSAIIAAFGMERLFAEYNPDLLFVFNGRLSSTRVAIEIAKKKNVRFVCHERGSLKESIILTENSMVVDLEHADNMVQKYINTPLKNEELYKTNKYLNDRRHGREQNWKNFSPLPQDEDNLRNKLGLSVDKITWVLFTSSDDEVIACNSNVAPFENQNDWINETIRFVNSHEEINLIIRIHPNTAGKNATGNNLQQMNELNEIVRDLPHNIIAIMPDDPVSSYTLMDISDLGLIYMSTVAIEMASLGKQIVICGNSPINRIPLVEKITSCSEYGQTLNSILNGEKKKNIIERRKYAYRFAYTHLLRSSIPFPLVKMPDIHNGKLNYTSIEQLSPGIEKNLDKICEYLIVGQDIDRNEIINQHESSDMAENLFFDNLIRDENSIGFSMINRSEISSKLFPNKVKVSVVITCYNYGRYLRDSVSSVVNQTFEDIEIIIVNDGSTDDTVDIANELIQAFGDANIELISQVNSGQPAISRNVGIDVSQGRYILCLDADDKIAPTMLEECLDILENNNEISIAYTDRADFDGDNQIVCAGEYNLGRLKYENHISYCALYRREVWENVGGYRVNVKGVEDWDFWIACGSRGYYGMRLPMPLFFYRRHDTGVFQEAIRDYRKKYAQIVINNQEMYDSKIVDAAVKSISNGRINDI